MAFDDKRGVLIVHGGTSGSSMFLRDLWEWDGASWSQRSAAGPQAVQRFDQNLLIGLGYQYAGALGRQRCEQER